MGFFQQHVLAGHQIPPVPMQCYAGMVRCGIGRRLVAARANGAQTHAFRLDDGLGV
jgi:hypothetical protein